MQLMSSTHFALIPISPCSGNHYFLLWTYMFLVLKTDIYAGMLLAGTLDEHLTEIDRSAEELFTRLCRQMAETEQINEELKANNQMVWVDRMNNIRSRATEIVNKELILV